MWGVLDGALALLGAGSKKLKCSRVPQKDTTHDVSYWLFHNRPKRNGTRNRLEPFLPSGYNAASLRFGGEMLELDDMLLINARSLVFWF